MSTTELFDDVSLGINAEKSTRFLVLKSSFLISFVLLLTACEGFKFTGSMCESLQPGQVSTECRTYDEEEAQKASEPSEDDSGECLKCNEAEKLEIHR
jgi:hypothetical protein